MNHVFTTETTQTTTLVLGLFPTMESKRRGNSLQTRNSTPDGVPFSRPRTRNEPSFFNGLARTIQISWHLSRTPPSAQPEMDENTVKIFGMLGDEICDSCSRVSHLGFGHHTNHFFSLYGGVFFSAENLRYVHTTSHTPCWQQVTTITISLCVTFRNFSSVTWQHFLMIFCVLP